MAYFAKLPSTVAYGGKLSSTAVSSKFGRKMIVVLVIDIRGIHYYDIFASPKMRHRMQLEISSLKTHGLLVRQSNGRHLVTW